MTTFSVDKNTCVGCGMCCEIANGYFVMDDDAGIAILAKQPVTANDIKKCEEAMDSCPVSAISEED